VLFGGAGDLVDTLCSQNATSVPCRPGVSFLAGRTLVARLPGITQWWRHLGDIDRHSSRDALGDRRQPPGGAGCLDEQKS
jgi:hypothetical protein